MRMDKITSLEWQIPKTRKAYRAIEGQFSVEKMQNEMADYQDRAGPEYGN